MIQLLSSLIYYVQSLHFLAVDCAAYKNQTFFGLPAWYKYLDVQPDPSGLNGCHIIMTDAHHQFVLNNIWLIGFAVVEALLRIAAILAIGYVVYGGVQYVTSQGEPDRTQKARSTIINAIIGLVIAVGSATLVSFIAGRFS